MSLIIPVINIKLHTITDKPPPKDPTQEREEDIKNNSANKVNTVIIYYSKVDKSTPRGPTASNTH